MKIHSLKLTIQDVVLKDAINAGVFGTLLIDDGKFEIVDGKKTRVYDKLQFTMSLDVVPEFKEQIKGMIQDCLVLNKLEVDREEYFMSHTIKQLEERAKNRVSKTRGKKK